MTGKGKSILLVPRYGRLGASSRQRMWQYVPLLEKAGFKVTVLPLFPDSYVRDLQRGRRNPLRILAAYLRQWWALLTVRDHDVTWIEKELFPWVPGLVERLLLSGSGAIVLDYDDAVFQPYEDHRSTLVRRLLAGKHRAAMRSSAMVTAGNALLANYARGAGAREVVFVPTVVDLRRYALSRAGRERDIPVVCWIGQQSTASFLRPFAKLFGELGDTGFMRFDAIGIDAAAAGLPMRSAPWSEATEAESIASCDIGIMPLPDTPFERGKCGYKLIQYMACGLPVVASPVGANRDIVEHGENGLLATSVTEWREALLRLARDPALRRKLGTSGRLKVENDYSLEVTGPRLVRLLGLLAE